MVFVDLIFEMLQLLFLYFYYIINYNVFFIYITNLQFITKLLFYNLLIKLFLQK